MPQPTRQYKPEPASRRPKAAPKPGSHRPSSDSTRRSKRDTPNPATPPPDPDLLRLDAIHTALYTPSPEQHLLNTITAAFQDDSLPPAEKHARLQTIKSLFFERRYTDIFTDQTLLPVYASEYIPGRALCYRRLFMELQHARNLLRNGGRIVCLGAGNGSELLGVAAAMAGMEQLEPAGGTILPRVDLHIQDLSDYGQVRHSLEEAIRQHYDLPPTRLAVESSCSDLLAPTPDQLTALTETLSAAKLTTAFFILNELLATNKSAFVKFITLFLQTMKPGSLFLVVDSAGSFSECAVGSQNYMVFHLLDAVEALEVLESTDAVWYRYPPNLSYPTQSLQNMRYFVRLYRKKRSSTLPCTK